MNPTTTNAPRTGQDAHRTKRVPRRIVAVTMHKGAPIGCEYVAGAYETEHFIMLPGGRRLGTSESGTEYWAGKPLMTAPDMRVDHYALGVWMRSKARAALAAARNA